MYECLCIIKINILKRITNLFLLRSLFKNIGFEMPLNTAFLPGYFTCEGKIIRDCQEEQFHFIKIYVEKDFYC